jgi:hypothetical protein
MKTQQKIQTPFEIAQQQAAEGKLQTPKVSASGKNIDYFGYQISVHKFNLGIMASGMLCRGVKLKDLKQYYGLTGKSAKDCLTQFNVIVEAYKEKLQIERQIVRN